MENRKGQKVGRIVALLLTAPFVLFVALLTLLYLPPVQHWAVDKATSLASNATDMDIRVGHIRLAFPLDLALGDVVVRNRLPADTLASLGELRLGVAVWPLMRGQVQVGNIRLADVQVSTGQLIPYVGIDGHVGELHIQGGDVDLSNEVVNVESLFLHKTNVAVNLLPDTLSSDTTSSPVRWRFFLDKAKIEQMDFGLTMPADTVSVSAEWASLATNQLAIDLGASSYGAQYLALSGGSVAYDAGNHPPLPEFDPNHIRIQKTDIQLDSALYSNQETSLIIRQLAFRERSGVHLTSTQGKVLMDSLGFKLPHLKLETASSLMQASGKFPWSALEKEGNDQLDMRIRGHIGKSDVLALVGKVFSESQAEAYPSVPLHLHAEASGNMRQLKLNTLSLLMDSVAEVQAQGQMLHVTNDKLRKGKVNLWTKVHNLDFLPLMVDSGGNASWVVPRGLNLEATLDADRTRYDAIVSLAEQDGQLNAKGYFDTHTQEYHLEARADSLAMHHFLPKDSFQYLTAHVHASGKGTNLYASTTQLLADVGIEQLQYRAWALSDINLNASLDKHQARVTLDSHNQLLKMQSQVDALLRTDSLKARANIDIAMADLQALQVSASPLDASVRIQLMGETDWTKTHAAQGNITNMSLLTTQGSFNPKGLKFKALTRPDSLYAQVEAGDLDLTLNGAQGVESLALYAKTLVQEVQNQLTGRNLNLEQVKACLPEIRMELKAGDDNPIVNYLQHVNGVSMEQVDVDIAVSPHQGIRGDAFVYRFRTDSLELDTMRAKIENVSSVAQQTEGADSSAVNATILSASTPKQPTEMLLSLFIGNEPNRRKPVFSATLNGAISNQDSRAQLRFLNGKGELGLDLGAHASLEKQGVRLSFFPKQPTIGFRPFVLNNDNYVSFSDSGRVEADVTLLDQAGTGVRLYSTPNAEATQDLTVDLKRLNLGEILEALPYAPEIAGMLDAEFHYIKKADNNTFSGTMLVEEMAYEGYSIGSVGMEAVYLPTQANEHIMSLQLLRDDEVIGSVDGTLMAGQVQETDDSLSATILLERFPVDMANAFVPRDIITMAGKLNGELSVKGATSSPRIDGEVRFDSVEVHSPLYAVDFRFDKTPVNIVANQLKFDDFNIYAKGKNPFTLTGNVDLNDFSHMTADLRMRAREYELLNAKKNKNSVLHGKAFISLFSTIKGDLTSPVVRGTMNVLGNTDVTYILKESPLTVEDRLGSLVTFVNFNDTTATLSTDKEVALGGLDMLLNVQIDQGAQVQVDLGSDNYVEVQGGGNLSMQYTPQGDLLLTGRYTLNSGQMKYSLPVIPLKTFNIAAGSYVEFTGDPANPYLNITATERVRTSVTEENNSRYVNFDVGVNITNSLDNMGLAFTLDAPEDVTLQNQLAAMSAEERGKLAVTMLVTGMYVGGQGGSTGGFSTNNALNSFLQHEISNIAGSALKTVDVSIGVEDNYAADGTTQGGTDYSFRFAKRFWNNRLSVIVGGRISTGNEAVAEEGNSFIDDISLEWRLDDSGTRYVKLFHAKNFESILEGEIIETGVGLVLRRKVNRLGELFIFKRRTKDEKE